VPKRRHATRGHLAAIDGTVFLTAKKVIRFIIKINYLFVLKSPLGRKFHANFKNDLKTFHIITEGHKFFH
jgi:hypothetical protein